MSRTWPELVRFVVSESQSAPRISNIWRMTGNSSVRKLRLAARAIFRMADPSPTDRIDRSDSTPECPEDRGGHGILAAADKRIWFAIPLFYSYRSASAGSTLVARLAGK